VSFERVLKSNDGAPMRSLLANFLLLSSTLIQAVAYSPAASAQGVETTLPEDHARRVIDFAARISGDPAAKAGQRAAESQVGVARTAYLPRTDLLWQTNRATANNIYGLLLLKV